MANKNNFFSLVATAQGVKAAPGAKSVTFVKSSAGLLIQPDQEEAFIKAVGDCGLLTSGDDAHTPTDFTEALVVFTEQVIGSIAALEDENLALPSDQRDPNYGAWKAVFESIVDAAKITFVVNGKRENEDGSVTNVKAFVYPAKQWEDGHTTRAGRINARVLTESDLEITAYGSVKQGDSANTLVVTAYGVGPHRVEGDPVYKKREEYRKARTESTELRSVAHVSSVVPPAAE